MEQGAAGETERALSFCDPEIAMLVGVAGGLKDVALGDVVAATKVYGYESGKAQTEFHARPELYNTAYDLQHRARGEAKREDWLARLGEHRDARAFVGPVASGEKVLASRQSDLMRPAGNPLLPITRVLSRSRFLGNTPLLRPQREIHWRYRW